MNLITLAKVLVFFNILVLIFGQNANALSLQKIQKTYEDHNQSFQIYCSVYDKQNVLQNVVSTSDLEFRPGVRMYQEFLLTSSTENTTFSLAVFPNFQKKIPQFELTFDNGPVYNGDVQEASGRLYKKEIRIQPQRTFDSFYQKFNLSQLTCYVEFAQAKDIALDENQHISVHPHTRYDYRGLLTEKIENISSLNKTNIVLLEDGNFKENLVDLYKFLITGKINLPINDYGEILSNLPDDTQLVVSPAGHNRYAFTSDNPVSISYSGGNHNYCIWNNTRKVLSALLESNYSPNLTINYLADSTVLQCGKGIIRGLGISCRSLRAGNLLADFLNTSGSQDYHVSYFQYFVSNTIPFYQHRYKEVHFNYQSRGFSKRVILKGSGSRILTVNIKYL